MNASRPNVLLVCDRRVREQYLAEVDIERLQTFADWDWFECEGGGIYAGNEDPEAAARLEVRLGEVEALVVCHGCPTLNSDILGKAPKLRFIGELEGDRFASRIDVEAA